MPSPTQNQRKAKAELEPSLPHPVFNTSLSQIQGWPKSAQEWPDGVCSCKQLSPWLFCVPTSALATVGTSPHTGRNPGRGCCLISELGGKM